MRKSNVKKSPPVRSYSTKKVEMADDVKIPGKITKKPLIKGFFGYGLYEMLPILVFGMFYFFINVSTPSSIYLSIKDKSNPAMSSLDKNALLTKDEYSRFSELKTATINDVITFYNLNAINKSDLNEAIGTRTIKSKRFWTYANGYYIYNARPMHFNRREGNDLLLKMDLLCSTEMPKKISCTDHDHAPEFIQSASSGKNSVLLYFKGAESEQSESQIL
jgi:hypothetical protein